MADSAERHNVFNAAILIVDGNNWTLDANAFIALSYEDAQMKALHWAKEKYPGAEGCKGISGYNVAISILTEKSFIAGLVETVRAALEPETYSESTFTPPKSDKLQ